RSRQYPWFLASKVAPQVACRFDRFRLSRPLRSYGGRSASKETKAYLLIDRYVIAHGCESMGQRLGHACSLPGAGDLQAVRSVVERAPDEKRSLVCLLVEASGDGLVDALIDCVNRLEPLLHIERSQLVAVGGDPGLRTDRLRIDEQTA